MSAAVARSSSTRRSLPDDSVKCTLHFKELKDNYPKTLMIYERYPLDEIEGIRVVNLLDWLLE